MLSVLLREVVRVSVHLHSRLNRFWLCWQGIREVNKHFSILKTLGRSGSGHLIHPVCYSVPGSLPSYFTSTILTLLCICRICVYSVSQPIEGTGCEEANICIVDSGLAGVCKKSGADSKDHEGLSSIIYLQLDILRYENYTILRS